MVYVDHDPMVTSAAAIQDALNAEQFGAHLKKDGGLLLKQAATATTTAPEQRMGRSQFHVLGICCASEIPAVRSIVEPLEGVKKVAVNVTTKIVYVDHDTGMTSATNICKALNDQKFGAQIKKDAGEELFALQMGLPTNVFVESTLRIPDMPTTCTASTTSMKDSLDAFPKEHVRSYVIHMPSQTITLEHNPYYISIRSIVDSISTKQDNESVTIIIAKDGGADGTWAIPLLRDGAAEGEGIEKQTSTVKPFVILSGVFWGISMLSYIGDNW
jgi:copper chaperone CopZ